MTNLPIGWVTKTLGEVAVWGSGGTPRAGNPLYYGGDIPWAVIGDLNDGYVHTTEKLITEEGLANSSAKLVPAGAILIAMYGSIGKMGIANVPMATNQAIAFALPKADQVIPQYLFWFLSSQRDIFLSNGKGATQQNISQTLLKSWEMPVPPLEEQKRIVEALGDHLSRLDEALAETQSAIAKATTYWHSMLHSLLFSDESGNLASTVELGSLAELVMGQAPAGSDCNKNGVGTPFVKVGEFGASSPEIREWTTKPLKMAKSSDVLICVVGATIGKLNLGIDCAIGRSVAAIRPGLKLRQKYLLYFLQTKVLEIRASSKGSAQGVITRQQLLEMPIPDLSLASQDRVIQSLETARSSLDHALSDLNKVSSSISTLRRSVLNSAFTGKLFTSGIETQ